MGTTIDRRVCEQTQYSTTTILEPSARPRGASIGCFPTDMATKRNVPVPTLEIHSKNNSANKMPETKTSSSCHTVLANSVLVANNTQDETQESTKGVQIRQVENDRMELIRNKRKTVDRLDEDIIEFLSHAHRKNTHRVYNSGWKKWITWCAAQNPIVLPEDYDVKNVLMFLKSNSHFSYQYLDGLHSSIASVFKILHPDQVPIANRDCIIEFFKAKKHKEILIPEKHRLQTWDTVLLTVFIKREWPYQKDINLYDLQQKTVILMCLITMDRPRSDVGRLQYRDVQLELKDNKPISSIIQF
ncbi:hypothetical protein G6F16_010446 [Rhizopus arrhizus]|nr:hypothetical protein G6F24_009958 [Rhizopus arrhizus]KAG0784363.1 hypothetical protein G6F21_009954 [Rhizopus arrhizus]KAG0786837.1 hypothetical protein G6F22_007510 [Rhizopus arrhizus]KAG0807401.1 hypothetical protein G6F20_010394 [Rhizopus arrhizus]KAG0824104.1 hypothetical protein G6F19_010502 [Rhizopus arrhizus]